MILYVFDLENRGIHGIWHFLSKTGRQKHGVLEFLGTYFMHFRVKPSLRKKCPYSELFSSVFSRIRTWYGKIRTRITPNTDTFYTVIPKHFSFYLSLFFVVFKSSSATIIEIWNKKNFPRVETSKPGNFGEFVVGRFNLILLFNSTYV